jgi:hypothetical protein
VGRANREHEDPEVSRGVGLAGQEAAGVGPATARRDEAETEAQRERAWDSEYDDRLTTLHGCDLRKVVAV